MRPGFIGRSWSFAIRSVIGFSCDGNRVEHSLSPHMPPPPTWRAPSRGPDLAQLEPEAQLARQLVPELAQVGLLLGAERQHHPAAVERHLGRERLRDDAALLGDALERRHRLARLLALQAARLLVLRRRAPQHLLERAEERLGATSWLGCTTRPYSRPRGVLHTTRSFQASSRPSGSNGYTWPPCEKTTPTTTGMGS